MRILDRYVLFTFLKNYLTSLLVLIGLYVVLDLVFNFDELIEVQTRASGGSGGASFLAVLWLIWDYYFYQVFLIFSQLSGVIPVVAAAFTFARFARFNELTAVLAAGVPLFRFVAPIILASVVLNVVLLPINQELVIPSLIPKLTRKHDEVGQQSSRTIHIDAMQDENGSLLFGAKYNPPQDNTPAEIIEFDVILRTPEHKVTGHIWADRAIYDETSRSWRLTKGHRVTGLGPQDRRSRELDIGEYKSDITPEEISLFKSGDVVELLSTNKINKLLDRPQSYGTIDLLRVKHSRVTQWVMNLVAVLITIGCLLTREPGRLKTDAIKLLVLVGLGMASVFLCHQLAVLPPNTNPEWTDRWPAIMGWLPIFIFAPVAIVLLDRVQTKKS